MFLLIGFVIFVSAFFLGRYSGQITTERINDSHKKILVGLCDTITSVKWLSAEQKSKLADSLIESMPMKDQRFIREKTDELMKMFGH